MAEARRTAGKTAKTAVKAVADTAAQNGEVVDGEVVNGAQTLRQISGKSGDLGLGFLGAAMSLWSAAYAYSKFRQVLGKGPILPEPPA